MCSAVPFQLDVAIGNSGRCQIHPVLREEKKIIRREGEFTEALASGEDSKQRSCSIASLGSDGLNCVVTKQFITQLCFLLVYDGTFILSFMGSQCLQRNRQQHLMGNNINVSVRVSWHRIFSHV